MGAYSVKKKKKPRLTQREVEELGLDGVDMTNSKAPAYRRNRRKKETLQLLKQSMGNVSAVCERIGISRQTFYKWRQNDPDFDEAVREINETTLDYVEQQMFVEIKKGNAKLIMFYLMNKGRGRGYSQKPEDAVRQKAVNIVISSDEAEF